MLKKKKKKKKKRKQKLQEHKQNLKNQISFPKQNFKKTNFFKILFAFSIHIVFCFLCFFLFFLKRKSFQKFEIKNKITHFTADPFVSVQYGTK